MWGLVSVGEVDEVAAAVARVAGIEPCVVEPACVSVLELDAVEGWLGVGGGLGEAQRFVAPVGDEVLAPVLDGLLDGVFAVDDFFAHGGIIPDSYR